MIPQHLTMNSASPNHPTLQFYTHILCILVLICLHVPNKLLSCPSVNMTILNSPPTPTPTPFYFPLNTLYPFPNLSPNFLFCQTLLNFLSIFRENPCSSLPPKNPRIIQPTKLLLSLLTLWTLNSTEFPHLGLTQQTLISP